MSEEMTKLSDEMITRIRNQIDRQRLAENVLALVAEESPTCHEEAAAELYCEILREYGLETELQYVQEGRPNVVGRVKGAGSGPTLLIGGHIDTIGADGCIQPKSDGMRIYGRGACDMKGSLISMAAAAGAVRKADVTLNGDLLVAAWIDHEDPDGRGLGPKELARKIRTRELDVNGVIVGEGPFDRLAIAQGGAAIFRISASGRKGAPHTSTCFLKSNPILWSSLIVEELYRMDQELESKEWHHLIPQRPSIQLGILRAGDFYNRLPGSVEIVGTVRWDPQENFKDVRTRLEGRLAQLEERIRSTLDHEIEMRLELDLSRDSSEIDCENPLVRAVQSAIAKTVGHPIPLAGWRVVSDQPFFVHEAGIPAIYFGPFTDDDMTAHSDCESVSIERLVLMAQVYAASALLYCGFTT